MELVLYNAVAALLGTLKDREAREQKHAGGGTTGHMGGTVSGLAHDLKTSLIAIGGFSRRLRKEIPVETSYFEKLDLIIAEGQRLEHMMEDMLDFARPLQLACSLQNVNQIVDQSLALLSDMTEGSFYGIHRKVDQHLFQP